MGEGGEGGKIDDLRGEMGCGEEIPELRKEGVWERGERVE